MDGLSPYALSEYVNAANAAAMREGVPSEILLAVIQNNGSDWIATRYLSRDNNVYWGLGQTNATLTPEAYGWNVTQQVDWLARGLSATYLSAGKKDWSTALKSFAEQNYNYSDGANFASGVLRTANELGLTEKELETQQQMDQASGALIQFPNFDATWEKIKSDTARFFTGESGVLWPVLLGIGGLLVIGLGATVLIRQGTNTNV
jgi:hypothetical protein